MNFATATFILFLPVVFAMYWSLRHTLARNALIVIASYIFYCWWDWRFSSLMLISSLVDYTIGLAMVRTEARSRKRLLLAMSLLANLGLLGVFKYYNFFAESFTTLAGSVGWEVSDITRNIVLPVGISFYTFQTLSYTIDIYRGQLLPTRNIVAFFAFVSFFPQLVAGPIERAGNLLPQFLSRCAFEYALAKDGLRMILWGMFKKIVLADNLAPIVDRAFATLNGNPDAVTGVELSLATGFFAFQIYCDFSAYSDIAIGTARLFGIKLTRNFAYPYFSQDVSEFWRRWHITLSTWFRDYVFIPLGGSRGAPPMIAVNIMITFLISGLWHGPAWHFVIWGALNGLAILPVLFRRRERKRVAGQIPGGDGVCHGLIPAFSALWRMICTFTFICLTWLFFRAYDASDAILALRKIGSIPLEFAQQVSQFGQLASRHAAYADLDAVLVHLLAFIVVEWVQRRHVHALTLPSWPRVLRWILYTAIIFDILYFQPPEMGAFIYFQF